MDIMLEIQDTDTPKEGFMGMKRIDEENITREPYEKQLKIKDEVCKFVIEDAQYGYYDGRKEVLDKKIIDNMLSSVMKVLYNNSTKYNEMPSVVTISRNIESKTEEKKQLFEVIEPVERLDDVIMSIDIMNQIGLVLSAIQNRNLLVEKWGLSGFGLERRAIVLNFYGLAGTGKSLCAKAIANKLNKKLIQVNYSELESKYVGETPKNITNVFNEAKKSDAVIVFDEADSFLSKRLTNITQAADYGVNITRSVMLMELEKYEGVVIFTTNLITNYDAAFKRRLLASIKFDAPDEYAREKIWLLHTRKVPLGDIDAKQLASSFKGITGADIKDIVYYAALIALQNEKEQVDLVDIEKAYGYVVARYDAGVEKEQ